MSVSVPTNEKIATPSALAISFAYLAVAAFIITSLAQGSLITWLQSYGIAQMASSPEIYAFIAIIVLAGFAVLLPGSHQKSIIYIAGVASFIALTLTSRNTDQIFEPGCFTFCHRSLWYGRLS